VPSLRMRGIVDLVIHDTNLGERHFFVKKLSEPLLKEP